MKAVVYEQFGQRPCIQTLSDPECAHDGVVIEVQASGVCRSDYHGWGGHDPVIELPHVPGHELAGVIVETGRDVTRFKSGDRVTVPFVGGCGACPECHSGNQQVCDNQFQPGFTHFGSFAQLVGIHHGDLNLVALPDDLSFTTAASLGCRFVTAFRAVVDQARVKPGVWVAIHGCGGVGLSAVMIARAMGARVICIDVDSKALDKAVKFGAETVVNAGDVPDVPEVVREATAGGAHISIDALGIPETCQNSVRSLRKRGRHVQVGWMLGDDATPPIPMDLVMGWELEIIGSHGMQAHRYGDVLEMIKLGRFDPAQLVSDTITLEQAGDALADFDARGVQGIQVITDFS